MKSAKLLRFGYGEVICEKGEYYGDLAIFIEPALTPGPVGEVTFDETPRDSVHEDGVILTFLTEKQRDLVFDALIPRRKRHVP